MSASAIISVVLLAAVAAIGETVQAAQVVAGFESLPNPPPVDGSTELFYANGNSSTYLGIQWDSRFSIGGKEYRVNPLTNPPPNPVFGIPHQGDYFASNQNGADGLLITTPWLLKGAWFGRNEYYGYGAAGQGGGSDRITIVALAGTTELGSVSFDLPDEVAGVAESPSFIDTSAFTALSGITGYRIDRRAIGEFGGNWVADDFTFETTVAVPVPGGLALFASALAGLAALRRRWPRT